MLDTWMLLGQVIGLAWLKHQIILILALNLNFVSDNTWEGKELELEVEFGGEILETTKGCFVTQEFECDNGCF